MKKTIIVFIAAFSLATISSFAQKNDGTHFKEIMKQSLKDSLHLTDAQIDSISSIQQEYQPRIRQIMKDQSLDKDAKKTQIAPIYAERRTKLKTILTDDQIAKLEAMEERMREQMRKRQENNSGNNN